jgi:hypothetical protein
MDSTSIEFPTAPSHRLLERLYLSLEDMSTPRGPIGDVETSSSSTATEDPPNLEVPKFSERLRHLNEIISQIRSLLSGPASDEMGVLRPTQHAAVRTVELLHDACVIFVTENRCFFPKADVSPDLEGGLRVEWTLAKATVTLVVPPKKEGQKEYICKRAGGVSNIETRLSGLLINVWLERFS